ISKDQDARLGGIEGALRGHSGLVESGLDPIEGKKNGKMEALYRKRGRDEKR
ncbi:uncharacterized protein BDR25DRAFT_156002, partial [Lindgomyces ingoldianus]